MEGIKYSVTQQIREIITAFSDPQEPPPKRHHADETTEIYRALRELAEVLAPDRQLDAHSVAVLKPLLSGTDTNVQHLATKILLNHNHDIALQTTDDRIVRLSFTVLSKFSDIFPEDSGFLSHTCKAMPIPISSGSLDLVLRAWKGEFLKQSLTGDEDDKISKFNELIKGVYFLSAEDSLNMDYLINKMMKMLAPDLYASIPERQRLRIETTSRTICESQYDQLKSLLTLARIIDYRVTLISEFRHPEKLRPLRQILESDQTYPIHTLNISYAGPRCCFETFFFEFLKTNQHLQSIEIKWNAWGAAQQRGLPDQVQRDESFHEQFLEGVPPESPSCADTLLDGLRGNRAVKHLVVRDPLSCQLSGISFSQVLQTNSSLEALTLQREWHFSWEKKEESLIAAFSGNTSLKKLELDPWMTRYTPHLTSFISMIRENPCLESLALSLRYSLCPQKDFTSLIQAVKQNPSIKEFCLSGWDTYHLPPAIEILSTLLDEKPSLRKLEIFTQSACQEEMWTPFVQRLANNKTLEDLNLFVAFLDNTGLFARLLTVVAQHPRLVRLGLPSFISRRQVLEVCEFIQGDPPLRHLHFNGHTPIGSGAYKSKPVLKTLLDALMHNTHLKSLDLSGCMLLDEEAMLLADYLENRHILEELRLKSNMFGNAGIRRLIEALGKNRSLKMLSFNSCRLNIPPKETRLLGEILPPALAKNQTLRHLYLARFYFSPEQLTGIRKAIRRKEYFNLELT